jgi:two-component system CheB/CheR fusion protein
VGASAGGLEACTALLKALPADFAPALVVIQHLDPHHRSLLRELLSKATGMPVTQVVDGCVPEPRHVYVIPPGRDLTVHRGVLRLSHRQQSGGRHMPIDRFLTSLAEDQKDRAVGVILSGTGTDGTRGLQAVKTQGGITFAQDPRSAQHPGMPESAIATGCVDFVLTPQGIARELAQPAPQAEREEASEHVAKILHALRTAAGIDFSLYKAGTIQRRMARRMALHKIESLERYAEYVEQNPAEARALGQDILVHVTSFFREPETFAALERTVFPKLVAGRPREEAIGIWVPGCSTGEEA